jgi:1,4-alpha-glucan branching enzyme
MKRVYSKTGRACRVTFALQPEDGVQMVALCGEFNAWNPAAHPMIRRKDGSFTLTLSLTSGQPYRFRYLLDGKHWVNDPAADTYVPNSFGSEDSVIQV